MINFGNTTFVKSITSISQAPGGNLPEVLLCGRSNVGKSSFINGLTNHNRLAYTSSKPGHTKLLNYFNVDNKLYLVDAPGYGYAVAGVNLDRIFKEMMDDIFKSPQLKLVLILLDGRRELSDSDIDLINYVDASNINYAFVFTKSDKLNQKEKAHLLSYLKELKLDKLDHFFTSSLNTKSYDKLKATLSNL